MEESAKGEPTEAETAATEDFVDEGEDAKTGKEAEENEEIAAVI